MTLKTYRLISLFLAIAFAVVGLLFLFWSSGLLVFFNRISETFGLQQSIPGNDRFYVILAVAYMYLVAMLAFLMNRNPREELFPFLLSNAKIASSVASFLLFLFDAPLLVYAVNCLIDGLIGVLAVMMYRSIRKAAT